MNGQLQIVRRAVRGQRTAAGRRARRPAARARARRLLVPQLPARRRPHLAGGHPARAGHRLAAGRREVHRLRRTVDDAHRAVAGRADPEGHRRDARPADGGGRAAPVPRLGGPLPRPDGPVPRRRVEPRQVDGPDRGLPARRAAGLHRDHGRSTRAGAPCSAPRSRSSRSAPRAPSGPTRRRPNAASRSSSGRCRPGSCTSSRARSTSSSCRRSTATSTRALAEMIPFERQFQTLHSLQNYFLLNELLAPGFADADRRHRGAAQGPRRLRQRFCERPYYFVRAATPQVLLDEVDRIL